MEYTTITIAASLLLIMFVLSGINKVSSYESTVENLNKKLLEIIPKTSLDLKTISNIGIIIVTLLEIVAPIIIVYYIFSKNEDYKQYAKYATWGLIIFTIVVTIMYHPPTFFSYYKSIPFLANMSLLGGLILLSNVMDK
jgi:uncharacterized membrane protein YphA (DoxX/SURF4 family)